MNEIYLNLNITHNVPYAKHLVTNIMMNYKKINNLIRNIIEYNEENYRLSIQK